MSEILDKNISYIKEYNVDLAEKILSLNEYTKSFEINTNLVGEYNILIDGMPIHSITGAEEEAVEIKKTLSHNSANSIHIVYGIGLGYLFDAICSDTVGFVILFEPDVELLRFVLDVVDFSAQFSSKKTFLVSNIAEFEKVFKSIFRYKTKVSFSALDYYCQSNKELYNSIKEKVMDSFGLISHNFSFQVNEIFRFLISTLNSLDKRVQKPLLSNYKDVLKGKAALVVSAGPSLHRNIEVIKKHRDKFVIFSVGTALKTLLKNGIVPDFLNVIEKNDTFVHFNCPETKDIMLICEPYTNESVFNKEFKKVFLTASQETEAARWYLEKINKPLVEFETKGTVAYHSAFSAYYLGCNPIVFVGQDLAYSDGDCYAKGSAFDDLKCVFDEKKGIYKIEPVDYERFKNAYYHNDKYTEEQKEENINIILSNFNKHLVTVNGQRGEKLPTSALYSLFITYLSDFAKRFGSTVDLLNASTGGAQIDGFLNIGLEEVVKKYGLDDINKNDIYLSFKEQNDLNMETVIKNIRKDITSAENTMKLLAKGSVIVEQMKNELSKYGKVTQKFENLLSDAGDLYVDITNNHTNKSKFLHMIALKELSEIAYLMKEYKTDLSFEHSSIYTKAFDDYFNLVYKRMRSSAALLSDTVRKLEEDK